MEEAFWRQGRGDALLHTSFMADVLGAVLRLPQMSLLMFSLSAQPRYGGAVGITMGCTAVAADRFCGGWRCRTPA